MVLEPTSHVYWGKTAYHCKDKHKFEMRGLIIPVENKGSYFPPLGMKEWKIRVRYTMKVGVYQENLHTGLRSVEELPQGTISFQGSEEREYLCWQVTKIFLKGWCPDLRTRS